MFSFFYRSPCRSRLSIFKQQQQQNQSKHQQQWLTNKSLSAKSTTTTTTKKKSPTTRRPSPTTTTPTCHSLAITPSLKPHQTTTNQKLVFQQCAGLRLRDGKPCQRQISVDPKRISSTTVVYCHSHRPLINTSSPPPPPPPSSASHLTHVNATPTVSSPYLTSPSMETKRSITSTPIKDCWSLWIGNHIGPRKRMHIQQEMTKPISTKDEAGYLYAYHITQGPRVSTHHFCYFKIGRSINPTRRLLQVIHKCNYQPKLLDIIPSPAGKRTKPETHMSKCPISHRVERLIHLELAALYPITGGFKCQGCGTTHREWFRVKRPLVQVHTTGDDDGGGEKWRRMTDQEVWMTKIRPVMLHWIQYGVAVSALQQALGSTSSSLV